MRRAYGSLFVGTPNHDSMTEFGFHDGDYVVEQRRPNGIGATGELVIAWYEPARTKAQAGGITLKRWVRRGGRKILQAGNPEQASYELKDGNIFEIQGAVLRAFRVTNFPRIS